MPKKGISTNTSYKIPEKKCITHGLTLSMACLPSIPTWLWRTPLHGHIPNFKEATQGNPTALEGKGQNLAKKSSPVLSDTLERMQFLQPTTNSRACKHFIEYMHHTGPLRRTSSRHSDHRSVRKLKERST